MEADTILGRKRFIHKKSKYQRRMIKEKENKNGTSEERANV